MLFFKTQNQDRKIRYPLVYDIFRYALYFLGQACQTQTTSRAAKATKTAKGASEIRKSPKWATLKKN